MMGIYLKAARFFVRFLGYIIGITDFLLKPFDPADLLDRVRRLT
jgi:DNA-binding response OmpR family regulator